jgi:hypothetical protein
MFPSLPIAGMLSFPWRNAELTLNTLRPFAKDPSRSAWHGIHGQPLDFAAHPIHPAGQLVVARDLPHVCPTWARHGTRGFYPAPALTHYRSHIIFIPSTSDTRTSNQLDLFPDSLFTFEDPTLLTPPPRSHLLPAIPLPRRLRLDRPRLPRPGIRPLQGHSPRTAHLPPTQYRRQLGAQRSTTARRLAPHPLLHHHFKGRRNVHRHGDRALGQRAAGPSHPYALTGSAYPDSTTNPPSSDTTNTPSSASTASAVAPTATTGASGAYLCPPSQPAPRLRSPSPPSTNSPLPRRYPARSRWSLPPPSCSFLDVFVFSFGPDWFTNLRQIKFPTIFSPSLVSDSPPKLFQLFARAFSAVVSALCVASCLVSHWLPKLFFRRCRTIFSRVPSTAIAGWPPLPPCTLRASVLASPLFRASAGVPARSSLPEYLREQLPPSPPPYRPLPPRPPLQPLC